MSEFQIAQTGGERGFSPAFLFCDHATNTLPVAYNRLGLSAEQLADHIAWDPGAGALTRALAARLQARALYCGYSRLLIDPNRGVERDDLIIAQSDSITIPANTQVTDEERRHRIARYFDPYHDLLDRELDAHMALYDDPLIISIHSFVRALRYTHAHRPWEAGVLWKDDEQSARLMIDSLHGAGLDVGDNKPYSAKAYNYTIDRHVGARGLRHLTLEIRQDLLVDETHVRQWADLLMPPLQALLGEDCVAKSV